MKEQTERALFWWTVIIGLALFWAGLLYLILPPITDAQEWHTANQATVAWLEVDYLENGDPIPAGSTIQYRVYLANAVTDPTKTNPSEVTTTPITELSQVVTLNTEGRFFVGVRAERVIVADGEVIQGDVSWSDDPAVVATVPFGLRFYVGPGGATGLNVVGGP